MLTTAARRTLVALATTAALLPAAPALAQTAPPTPSPSPSATPTPSPTTPTAELTALRASAPVIDFGDTVDVTVTGTPGLPVSLLIDNQRISAPRVIRTATIGTDGSVTWTGLRPEDTTSFSVAGVTVDPVFGTPSPVTVRVRVRREVTIGVQQRTRGIYTFSGQISRAEASVQVTIARLDDITKRVTGVASTRTTADGRYEIRTSLPQGLAGYYALTETTSGLEAGRSRLYGLLVNTRPGPAAQSITLDVGLSAGNTYIFSGRVTNGANVPVTLARLVDGRLVGVAGRRTQDDGGYVFRVPVTGTSFFQVITASARSRVYGLAVPRPVVPAGGTAAPGPVTGARPDDVNCGDFRTQRQAQAFYDRWFPRFGDFARLDQGGRPGVACESLP